MYNGHFLLYIQDLIKLFIETGEISKTDKTEEISKTNETEEICEMKDLIWYPKRIKNPIVKLDL